MRSFKYSNGERIELKTRVQIALADFFRSATIFGVDDVSGIAADAYRFLETIIKPQIDHIRVEAKQRAERATQLQPAFFRHYDEAAERELQRIESELQLWELQLKRTRDNPTATSHIFNVSGSYNIIQAGTSGSSASIIIDNDSRQALLDGLTALRTALARANELDAARKAELEQVIDDSEHEIKKETPNRTRLLGSLQAIATTIQTTASLQPAWEIVRRGLQLLGLG